MILRVNNVDITNVKSFNDTVAKLDAEEAGGAADPRRERHALRHVPARTAVDQRRQLTRLSAASTATSARTCIAALKQFQGRYDFDIEVVDVDRHPQLEEKWGDKVPVLLDGEREICHYYLDIEAVDARLARMK